MSEITVLYESAGVVAVAKPPGWLTREASRPGDPRPVLKQALERQLGTRLWVVHRLDAGTTGVVAFATTEQAHRDLSMRFENHQVRKLYRALSTSPNTPAPMIKITADVDGKRARSQVTHLNSKKPFHDLRVEILTGRRHQVRLHLRGENLPIVGDREYGGVMEWNGMIADRPLLHAEKLVLSSDVEISCPLWEDHLQWLSSLTLI